MSPRSNAEERRLLLRLIFLGFGLRLALLFFTLGSNDVGSWYWFAQSVARDGLERTYLDQVGFNHPPLMGLLSMLSLRISEVTGLRFPSVFKVPSVAAEAVTAWLLYRIWSERSGSVVGLRAAAAYALALSPMMISGYHGNTDAIYFCLALASAYLMESRQAPFWSGLAMAGALNVKLIPVVAVLPLWSRCARRREAGRYAAGGVVGALPFLWTIVTFGADARRALLEQLFLYRSNLEYWGVELFVRWGQTLFEPIVPSLAALVRSAGDLYAAHGGELVMLATAFLAARHAFLARREGRAALNAYELVFLGFAFFLVLGPGFGVQYVGCVVAPLIAMNIRRGIVVATATGVFITAIYATFMGAWFPAHSMHGAIPASFTPLALTAWGAVLWAAKDLWGPLAPRRGHVGPGGPGRTPSD
jgi:hypothetical protein